MCRLSCGTWELHGEHLEEAVGDACCSLDRVGLDKRRLRFFGLARFGIEDAEIDGNFAEAGMGIEDRAIDLFPLFGRH